MTELKNILTYVNNLLGRDSYTCLDGKRQSPVNLSDADATDGNFSSLVLSNYGNVWPFLNVNLELFAVSSQYYLSICKLIYIYVYIIVAFNLLYFIMFTVKIHPLPYRPRLLMSGGGLRDEYELNEIFFRWPAEHTVYGKRLVFICILLYFYSATVYEEISMHV